MAYIWGLCSGRSLCFFVVLHVTFAGGGHQMTSLKCLVLGLVQLELGTGPLSPCGLSSWFACDFLQHGSPKEVVRFIQW